MTLPERGSTMASDIIFYTNPMSRGQIIRWMLEEVGAPYDTEILDYASGMKGEAYRAINPMMKVPAIAHHGRVVTEAAAICAYLADVFPEAGLGPREDEKADYYRWMFFAAGPLEQAVTNNYAGFQAKEEHPDGALPTIHVSACRELRSRPGCSPQGRA